ncbi:MAG TPA: hypothetical protein EYQ21_03755 [Flavobacteriales bacterium]|jgi:hypothetical protein|nr:hypothetical protein [Flavobacteriales bacterium]
MGDLVDLNEYKDKLLLEEIAELRKELELIMSSWPKEEGSGYFLSLEEMDRIEKLWLEEKRK